MAIAGKRTFRVLIKAAVVAAVAVLIYEVAHWLTHVYESGARVQTELTAISAQIDGTIREIPVQEGERVAQGDLLAALVDDDIRLRIEALRTDLSLEEARRASLVSERDAFEAELESKLATQREKIRSIESEHRAVLARLKLAEANLERVNVLFKRKLTSERDLALEQDKVLVLRGAASLTLGRMAVARKDLEQIEATRKQLEVIGEKIKISHLNRKRIQTMIGLEEVRLGFRRVRSPIDGIIDRIYKYKGEYVEEGDRILILHDERLSWVEAYVDEDQIRHVRVGQEVEVNFDAYPFRDFMGTVRRIGSATSEEMGIVTAKGNQFGRPAERVPVRILLRDPPPELAPGMLADVNIRIYPSLNWIYPILAW